MIAPRACAAAVLAVAFSVAATTKVAARTAFVGALFRGTAGVGIGYEAADRVASVVIAMEFVAAAVVLARPWIGPMTWYVGSFLVAFSTWDAARFLAGDAPDCGCFGNYLILKSWTAVALKHAVLWVAFFLYRGNQRGEASTESVA